MPKQDISAVIFAKVYPLYIQKAERKDRTKAEVDQIIWWLTGYNQAGLKQQIKKESDFKTFFAGNCLPSWEEKGTRLRMSPFTSRWTGQICF